MTRLRKLSASAGLAVRLIKVLGLALALFSCGTPTQPNSIAGNWSGTLSDSSGRSGSATLALTDDRHDILLGTFSYLAADCSSGAKPVMGKVSGAQVSLSQTPPDPIPTALQLTVDSTDQHLTGSYSDANGNCSSSGTIALTKPPSN